MEVRMKKKFLIAVTMFSLLFSAGCAKAGDGETQDPAKPLWEDIEETGEAGQDSEISGKNETGQGMPQEGQSGTEPGTQPEENADAEFRFADLSGWVFYFSSGAGGWHTELSINSDGTFRGMHMDSDMGDTGEAYPNGTEYDCAFSGSFSQPEKVDAFTYKMNLVSLTPEKEPETEEIRDGVRIIYSTPYGLDGGETFYVYLPGAKIADLPESYRQWVGYYNMEAMTETELSFYGLYNVSTGDGFSSNQYEEKSLSERIALEISYAEERDLQLQEQLQNDTTQTDMNLTAQELYQNWDDALNTVWKLLESELDDARMEALRAEERTWIASKDEALNAVSQEYAGGSIESLEVSLKAAELTKERVYELAEYGE